MQTIILIVHLFAAVGVIGLVLLQQGKGADMGAAFGSGASSTFFGARGSGSALTRATAILAAVFFVTSIALATFSATTSRDGSVVEEAPAAQVPAVPQEKSDMPEAPAPDVPTPKQ